MSECSKYQLLLQTDYVRLREKYDHLYIYSHILSYIALRESSQIFFLKQKILVPSSVLTAVVRQSLPAKQWLTETRWVSTVKCENSCPVECFDGCCKTIGACEQLLTETRRVYTVKCENSCPVEYSDGCCKTIAACETVVDRNLTGSLLSICNVMNVRFH